MINNKKSLSAGIKTTSNSAYDSIDNSTHFSFTNTLPEPWVLAFVRVEVAPYNLGCDNQFVADMEEQGYKVAPVWDDTIGISIHDWIWRNFPTNDSTRENIMRLRQGLWRAYLEPNGCITYRYEVKP